MALVRAGVRGFCFFVVCLAVCTNTVLSQPASQGVCHSRFLNPITDVCWQCLFPISIGAAEIAGFGMQDNHADNVGSPVCTCPIPVPPYQRIGLRVGYWEPSALIDVTKDPFCLTNLGMDLGVAGLLVPGGFNDSQSGTGETGSFYHVHYYHYPLFELLGLVLDGLCAQSSGGFDIAYLSEFDVFKC